MTDLEHIQAEIGGTTQAFEMVIALILAKAHEDDDSAVEYLESVLQGFKDLVADSLKGTEALSATYPQEDVDTYVDTFSEAAESTLEDIFQNAINLIAGKRGPEHD
ncbi:hypothetical protein L1889_08870 [Paenalcaligenes niemegkensis]|uniref:hypothetical protein n=1 Tax=Paenalcaligenes niemegkensis TaxID=2895469 RepID=UPI001EE80ACE|nr:hypothetical protein [Paenalcaligenes niemegkensis]MCQ9616804.1 hypothetical protein [Paenalcaligenes niemegkensis]